MSDDIPVIIRLERLPDGRYKFIEGMGRKHVSSGYVSKLCGKIPPQSIPWWIKKKIKKKKFSGQTRR